MQVRNLGYPRLGRQRELKSALELFWSGSTDQEEFLSRIRKLCIQRWTRQFELGVDSIPLNDFSFYDHILDTVFSLGAIPKRFTNSTHWLNSYFEMARGAKQGGNLISPLDLSKWFNTNYHYLVPELDVHEWTDLRWEKLRLEFELSRSYPYKFHGTLVGPWTLVRLSRISGNPTEILKALVPRYQEILREFKRRNIEWVQMDEPGLCFDLVREDLRQIRGIYEQLSSVGVKLMLTTYFESPDPWISEVGNFPVSGLHLDLVRGSHSLSWLKTKTLSREKHLSLGIVNGRNVWVTDLSKTKQIIQSVLDFYPAERVFLAPSCSLMHLPVSKDVENKLDPQLKSWISFADERLTELVTLKKAFNPGNPMKEVFEERDKIIRYHSVSTQVHRSEVKIQVERIDESMKRRKQLLVKRAKIQANRLKLPLLPTSTIGSFPQGQELRKLRSDFRLGNVAADEYEDFLKQEIKRVITLQEKIGLDVLVHGESERNDMVEYFAGSLDGFACTENAWVQSYGSRCVRPPILYGDVKRATSSCVKWFEYAQGLTEKPVKAILTGPVTMLNWSFVRDDQSREKTAYQIALALREEVRELEAVGAKIIQIDEPALREGLPIKRAHWHSYLKWAIDAFRLVSGGVKDETQIQTHMCYSELYDIWQSILKMDADVLLIESARSGSAVLNQLKNERYPYSLGLGIYDSHSPYVPSKEELQEYLSKCLSVISIEKLWLTPDCGLKTRTESEVEEALSNMVSASSIARKELKAA